MIAYLEGTILTKGKNFLVVLTSGVGYKVFVDPILAAESRTGEKIELHTYYHAREDGAELYGFIETAKLAMFELLLSVSGIGPKSALGVLSVAGAEEIKSAVGQGDWAILTKVSGIGRKTAERIVLELRNKIGVLPGREESAGGAVEEIDALMALGYSLAEAREALKKVAPETKDSGERIREALKKIR